MSETPRGWRAEISRCDWGYEARITNGLMEMNVHPWRLTRRGIERVARRRVARLRRNDRETYWLDREEAQ